MGTPGKYHRGSFGHRVGEEEKRRLKAQHEHKRSAWSGFGFFGMVGWSVVVPTLAGVMLGRLLDQHEPVAFSWTLTLLIAGLITGCIIAGNWIRMEHRDMHRKNDDDDT